MTTSDRSFELAGASKDSPAFLHITIPNKLQYTDPNLPTILSILITHVCVQVA